MKSKDSYRFKPYIENAENISYFTKKYLVKYLTTAFLYACILSACSSPEKPVNTNVDSTLATAAAPAAEDDSEVPMEARILGSYVGDFGGNPLYITINYCSGINVAGYNVHKGLRRNLSGTIKQSGNNWEMVLNEPGDHPYDGRFLLLMDSLFATAEGKWIPTNSKTLKEKQLEISRVMATNEVYHDYAYNGNHCDIKFSEDGSCILNYYPMKKDSTYSDQMITVRGTWKAEANDMRVIWQHNEQFGKHNTLFKTSKDEDDFMTIKGEQFEFTDTP
jgi:hypothetical protein